MRTCDVTSLLIMSHAQCSVHSFAHWTFTKKLKPNFYVAYFETRELYWLLLAVVSLLSAQNRRHENKLAVKTCINMLRCSGFTKCKPSIHLAQSEATDNTIVYLASRRCCSNLARSPWADKAEWAMARCKRLWPQRQRCLVRCFDQNMKSSNMLFVIWIVPLTAQIVWRLIFLRTSVCLQGETVN